MIGRRQPPETEKVEKPLGFDDFDLRLGDLMRGERATIGKSLLDVQRELKIKASYIAAIENCDVAAFETPGFIAGYVRSYARYLGMDPEWAYARFCEEADFTVMDGLAASGLRRAAAADKPVIAKPALRDPLANPRASFIPSSEPWHARIEPGAIGSITVLVLLIGALGYGGWTVMQEVQRVQLAPVDEAPGVVANLDPLAGAGVPEPSAGLDPVAVAGGGDSLDRIYRPPALDVPVMVARDGPISTINPDGVGSMRDAARAEPDAGPATLRDAAPTDRPGTGGLALAEAAPTVPQDEAAGSVQVVQAGPPKVEIVAVRPSWVRVQAANGTVLFEKILDAGERYEVPQTEEPARLRAGNSGSVYFLVDGQTYGPSAPGANIARNVNLAADALRDTYAVADLDRDPDLARFVAVAEVQAD